MRAELIAVGSELLRPGRIETNASALSACLLEIGIETAVRVTVADDAALLEGAFRTALSRADLVISTGGLGPTEDDLTREAAAAAVARSLHRDAAVLEAIRARFARFGRTMAPVNEKQADVIRGATVLPNENGTAPGQRLEVDGRTLVLLPGPPHEMQAMFDAHVLPSLRDRAGETVVRTRILKIACLPESDVEERVAPLYRTFTNPRTTILGAAGQVELHLTAEGGSPGEAMDRIEELASGLRAILGDRLYSEDGRELHEVVAERLIQDRLTLTLAESCTGGALAARLTQVPGASAFLDRAYVTYSNRSKVELLGVSSALIDRVGAVSEEVAVAMATGARRAAQTDLALSITGIAGPAGGTAEKPVGLVFFALESPHGVTCRRVQFPGDRERIRRQATQWALEMLRRALLGLSPL